MKTNFKRLLSITLLVIIALAGGYYLGNRTGSSGEAASSSSGDDGRKVLYWQSPMNPTEIYDAPGKSVMGMDLVPVYADEPDAGSGTTGSGERKILYWQSPMNPTEIYDAPGKSVMGMDLVPVYADEAGTSSGGTIRIDPATVQNMGVRTIRIERQDFNRFIRTVGEVDYDEELLYLVNSKISGWIEKLYVNFVGDNVRKGDPLMEIYSPELVATQEEYLLALKNYEYLSDKASPSVHKDAEQLLESARKRLEYWDIPESEIKRLQESGEVRKTILIPSPASGIVIQRTAIEGAFIKAGMDLFKIADLSTIWVHASFYDNEMPWLSVGQKVEMELSYLPGKKYEGRISYIYPFLREKARDVHVRLIFQNPNLDLKPGMYANIQLTGATMKNVLVIPSEAIIRSGERSLVFVVRGPGEFEPREIKIGQEGGEGNAYVHVLSGLLGSEEIVISAQFMLDSESRLQEAIQKMLASRSAPAEDPGAADADSSMPEMDMQDMNMPAADSMDSRGSSDTSHTPSMSGMDMDPTQ